MGGDKSSDVVPQSMEVGLRAESSARGRPKL